MFCLMRSFHRSFLYILKYDCLLFLEHVYKGEFDAFVESDLWVVSDFSAVCFSCVWVMLLCCFACPIIFCCWTTLASDFPLHLALISVICLFVCWITWLDNFSELGISYSRKLLVLPLVEPGVGWVHSHSGSPGGSDGKASACRSPWRRGWLPTPVSCLENSMDRGAWWVIVYGVAKSRIRLSA